MKKMVTFAVVLFLSLSTSIVLAGDGKSMFEVGKKVDDIELKSVTGEKFSLHKTLKDSDTKGVVFVFVSKNCPVSIACDERYKELAAHFAEKGVVFAGINSNKTESVDEIRDSAKEKGFNFPVLKDWENKVADKFGAEFTPHAYLIDKDGVLIYKGRIDDNHRNAKKVKENTLEMVVGEYLMGKKLSYTTTKSNGCTIKRVDE